LNLGYAFALQIVASLPDAQDQGPIDLVNGVEQSMYQYMNNIRYKEESSAGELHAEL
jgi:hypothetical protein